MSYILEALRKADAERERGAVPDLQSQLLPGSPLDDEPVASPLRRWLWPALGVALLVIGAVGWRFLGSGTEPDSSPPVASTPTPSIAPAPSVAPAAAESVTNASSSPDVAASTAAAEAAEAEKADRAERAAKSAKQAEPAKTAAKPPKNQRAGESAKAQTAPAKKAESRASPTDRAKAPAASPPTAVEPAARLPRLNELPDELRRQVPALAIGGWVYSPQVEKRMVIVNGQVFQEGALLAPELKLEQVRPKSAVFSIRGQRFEMSL